MGFLHFIAVAAQWIWNGIQAAAVLTVHALSVIVGLLWSGVKVLGQGLATLGRGAWKVLRNTWDHVLKPAWTKFFKFVDKIHDRLEKVFGPALRKLNALRKRIQGWWKKYVRPVLDVIEVTRRVLRVAASLHIPFAHALDVELGKLEEKIEKAYRLVLAKVNEMINLLDRVITLDGLIQRVALIDSLVRDYEFAWRAIVNPYSRSIPDADRTGLWTDGVPDVHKPVARDIGQYLENGGGPDRDAIRAAAHDWATYLGAS